MIYQLLIVTQVLFLFYAYTAYNVFNITFHAFKNIYMNKNHWNCNHQSTLDGAMNFVVSKYLWNPAVACFMTPSRAEPSRATDIHNSISCNNASTLSSSLSNDGRRTNIIINNSNNNIYNRTCEGGDVRNELLRIGGSEAESHFRTNFALNSFGRFFAVRLPDGRQQTFDQKSVHVCWWGVAVGELLHVIFDKIVVRDCLLAVIVVLMFPIRRQLFDCRSLVFAFYGFSIVNHACPLEIYAVG